MPLFEYKDARDPIKRNVELKEPLYVDPFQTQIITKNLRLNILQDNLWDFNPIDREPFVDIESEIYTGVVRNSKIPLHCELKTLIEDQFPRCIPYFVIKIQPGVNVRTIKRNYTTVLEVMA